MNKIERMYELVRQLRTAAPRPINSRELAERLGVSKRTIERDLARLRHAGIGIRALAGTTGGHVLDSDRSLPPLMITPAEAAALAVALDALAATPYAAAARSLREKVRAVAPTSTPIEADQIEADQIEAGQIEAAVAGPELVGSDLAGSDLAELAIGTAAIAELAGHQVAVVAPKTAPPRITAPLKEALDGHHPLRLTYADSDGAETDREVEPMGFLGGPHWYLLGWCRLRSAVRGFRLDRIQAAVPLPESVPERDISTRHRDAIGAALAGHGSPADDSCRASGRPVRAPLASGTTAPRPIRPRETGE